MLPTCKKQQKPTRAIPDVAIPDVANPDVSILVAQNGFMEGKKLWQGKHEITVNISV